MAILCGECEFFQGSGKCDAGTNTHSSNTIAKGCTSFKGPASFFEDERCGGCRLFEGNSEKCGGGNHTSSPNRIAKGCNSYAPIRG